MTIRFTKMHGLGNDYLFIDAMREEIAEPARLARLLSDRHRGVGSDGLILILPPEGTQAQARMQMFNADGSEGEMCGNGIRCVGKFLLDRAMVASNPLRIETAAGERMLECFSAADGTVDEVTVSMGEPALAAKDIPATLDGVAPDDAVIAHPIDLHAFGFDQDSMDRGGIEAVISLVSMGNPHAIIYCEDPEAVDLARAGSFIEHHHAFPQRINVHLVGVDSDKAIRMRSWERGSGLTQACGTGACAACVAGVLSQRHGATVTAQLPGGQLALTWAGMGHNVLMRGPAVEVFQAEVRLEELLGAAAS